MHVFYPLHENYFYSYRVLRSYKGSSYKANEHTDAVLSLFYLTERNDD